MFTEGLLNTADLRQVITCSLVWLKQRVIRGNVINSAKSMTEVEACRNGSGGFPAGRVPGSRRGRLLCSVVIKGLLQWSRALEALLIGGGGGLLHAMGGSAGSRCFPGISMLLVSYLSEQDLFSLALILPPWHCLERRAFILCREEQIAVWLPGWLRERKESKQNEGRVCDGNTWGGAWSTECMKSSLPSVFVSEAHAKRLFSCTEPWKLFFPPMKM